MIPGRIPRHSHEVRAAVGSGAPTYSAPEGALYWDLAANSVYINNDGGTGWTEIIAGGGGGAPSAADYLVGSVNPNLSAEIVVGVTPGGELGGSWVSPTVDALHSGSIHHVTDTLAESTPGAGVTVDGLPIKDGEANLSILNGAIEETIDASVSSDGATITFSVQKEGGGNLTLLFSDGFTTFVAAPATIALTAGSATSPQSNYVYILQSNKTLTVSTSAFPSAEHAPLATVIVQTAALVQANGALKLHAWTDHLSDADNQGQISHFTEWIREQHATWKSGVSQTLTITGGAPDTIDFATTSGSIFQLHPHTMPAKNTATGSVVHVVNDNASPYTTVTDLADLLTDNTGASMSGKYFNLVIWASISEAAADSQLFVNLPGGSYSKQTDAEQDVSGFTVFDLPADFKGAAFLISRLLLKHSAGGGGTWTAVEEADLRGKIPSAAAGTSTQAIATTFADNAFRLFDEGDVTRLLDFQLSGITAGNTRTWTVPDEDMTLIDDATSDPLIDANSASDGTEGSLARKDHVHPKHHAKYTDAEAISAVEGEATLVLGGAVSILSGNLDIGSRGILTTTHRIDEETSSFIAFRNRADTAYARIRAANVQVTTAGGVELQGGNTQQIHAQQQNDGWSGMTAWDTGVGRVEIARLAGAADPYFAMGGSQEFKFTNAGLMGLYGVAAAAQPAHIVDADGTLADITTKFNQLLADMATLGLQAAA